MYISFYSGVVAFLALTQCSDMAQGVSLHQHHKLNLDEPLGNSAISIAAQSDSDTYKEFFSDLGDLFDKKSKAKSDHLHSGDKPGASDFSQTFGEDNHDDKKTSDLT